MQCVETIGRPYKTDCYKDSPTVQSMSEQYVTAIMSSVCPSVHLSRDRVGSHFQKIFEILHCCKRVSALIGRVARNTIIIVIYF